MSAAKKVQQQQLQLTYSVGDWVYAIVPWTFVVPADPAARMFHKAPRARLLARIESATPIETAAGDVWLVRVYYSPNRKARARKKREGWFGPEHRHIDRALNPAEIASLRNANIIPPAGQMLPGGAS